MQDGDKQEPGNVVEPSSAENSPRKSIKNPKAEVRELDKDAQEASNAGWQFNSEERTAPVAQSTTGAPLAEVSWTASEFIAHEKAASWYGVLGAAGVAVAALVYLFTRDWISTVMIVVVTIIFGVFAARKPRTLDYRVNQDGIHIGHKFYGYGDFKSFSIVDEGGVSSIWLMPLKRFMPGISIYYAPDDEDRITDVLANYLPFEERDHDMVDRLMRKVKF